jgi:hypothetical protein
LFASSSEKEKGKKRSTENLALTSFRFDVAAAVERRMRMEKMKVKGSSSFVQV